MPLARIIRRALNGPILLQEESESLVGDCLRVIGSKFPGIYESLGGDIFLSQFKLAGCNIRHDSEPNAIRGVVREPLLKFTQHGECPRGIGGHEIDAVIYLAFLLRVDCHGTARRRKATFETIRRAFLKIAVRIEELKARVKIALPSAYPYQKALVAMAGCIAAQGP